MYDSLVDAGVVRAVTEYTAEDGAAFIELFKPCIIATRAAKGCVQYDLLQAEDEKMFQLVEAWTTEETMTKAGDSAAAKALKKGLTDAKIEGKTTKYTAV